MWLLLILPLAGARAGEFSSAPALEIPAIAGPAPAALPAAPQLPAVAMVQPAALPAAEHQFPAAVAQKGAQVAALSRAQNLDPKSQGDLIEQVLEGGGRPQLVAAGFDPDEAEVVLRRVDRRLTRIESLLKARPEPWLEHNVKSAWLLSVLTGVRPAALFHAPVEHIEALRLTAQAVNPEIKVAQVGRPGAVPYVVVYDPGLVLQAMRRSSAYPRKSVSLARELRKIERSREGPAAALDKWIEDWLSGLPSKVDHRVGVLLGYPLNDVADLVEETPPPAHCNGPACVTVHYGGDQANGVFWLTLDASHPEARKTETLFRVSLDAAAKRIGHPPARPFGHAPDDPSAELLRDLKALALGR